MQANWGQTKGRLGGKGILLSMTNVVGGVNQMVGLMTMPEREGRVRGMPGGCWRSAMMEREVRLSQVRSLVCFDTRYIG